jgi:methyl-accepting chemotaxis protein
VDNEPENALQQALEAIERLWLAGVFPKELPGNPEDRYRFEQLLENFQTVQQFALSLSRGDLSQPLKVKGLTAAGLKALQSNLRHLTWQAQMIAQGDFTQRVDFMGEFSEAFNSMVGSLAEARIQLEMRAVELSRAN